MTARRLGQLPVIRRSQMYSELVELQRNGQLTADAVMSAFDRHIEAHARRLGALCNRPGCDRILTYEERPFAPNSMAVIEECPVHGQIVGPSWGHPTALRLAVAFVPDGYEEHPPNG